MATLRQVIVDTGSSYSGYDYSDLQTAESNEQGNISSSTGTDEYVVFECYATSGIADSGVTFDGWTTENSGGNYVEVNGLLDSNYGHRGVWDDNEYRIVDTTVACIRNISCGQFRVIGLQLYQNLTIAPRFPINDDENSESDGLKYYTHNIIKSNNHSTQATRGIDLLGGASAVAHVNNNIIYDIDCSTTSIGIFDNIATAYIYNNTVIGGNYGVYRNGGTSTVTNNLFQDQSTSGHGSTGSPLSGWGYNLNNDPTLNVSSASGTGTDLKTGTATSYTANKLNDSGGGLTVAKVNSIVVNTTDSTYAYVTVVDSGTQLTLSADIFDNGNEGYRISSNFYAEPTFQSGNYLLDNKDIGAMFYGTNLYADSNSPVTDDILLNSRGSSSTDNFDIGAHHSLEYARIVDTDSGTGYDYSSLNNWESNEQADLTATGLYKISVATCRCTGGTADSTLFTIDGFTTEAANYIKIWTDPAESYRHEGSYPSGNKYRYEVSHSDEPIVLGDGHVRFEGISFKFTSSVSAQTFFDLQTAVVDFRLEKCIFKDGGGAFEAYGIFNELLGTGDNFYMSNCVMYDCFYAFRINGGDADSIYIYNNTFVDLTSGLRAGSHTILKNNIISGTGDYYDQTFSSSSGYNIHNGTLANGAFGSTHATGTATSYTASKLNDSGGGLSGAKINSIVKNTTDTTYAYVTAIDSDTQLSLSADIFDNGDEGYVVYTNMYGSVDFNNSGSDDFTLDYLDENAILKGTNLYSDSNYPVTDDILGNSRGSADTDYYDIGAHHSLVYGHIVDTDSGTGYDYTSLSSWESNEQADLSVTGLNKISRADCTSSSGTADTTSLTSIIGWTTTADNYIYIVGDTLTQTYIDTTKYRIEITDDTCLDVREDYVRLESLQFKMTYSSSDTYSGCVEFSDQTASANDIRVSKCILACAGSPTNYIGLDINDANPNLKVWNTVIYDFPRRGIEFAGATLEVYNSTIEGATGVDGIFANSGNITIKNCAVWNCNDDIDVGGASSSTIDTCATDDGDGDNSITPSNWANVFEDWLNHDYRLKSTDTDLKDKGLTDPGSGLFSDDIFGTERPQ